MSKITNSASKIVFILMALTACAGFLTKVLPVEQFMTLTAAAFAFYFSHKGETSKDVPFAGK